MKKKMYSDNIIYIYEKEIQLPTLFVNMYTKKDYSIEKLKNI